MDTDAPTADGASEVDRPADGYDTVSSAPSTRTTTTESGADDAMSAGSIAIPPSDAHANGIGCAADWECESGFCSENVCMDSSDDPASDPAPYTLHANGEGCAEDAECESGVCEESVCIARPTGDSSETGETEYPLHENGVGCAADWECESGVCTDSTCVDSSL